MLLILLESIKPIILGNRGKITARLPTHRIYFCLDNRVLSVGKTFIFLSVLFILLHQDYTKILTKPKSLFCGHKKMTWARSWPVFAQSFDTPPPSCAKCSIILTNHKKGCFEFWLLFFRSKKVEKLVEVFYLFFTNSIISRLRRISSSPCGCIEWLFKH